MERVDLAVLVWFCCLPSFPWMCAYVSVPVSNLCTAPDVCIAFGTQTAVFLSGSHVDASFRRSLTRRRLRYVSVNLAAGRSRRAPAMFAGSRGSSSSAGAKRGEIIGGVHAEGKCPFVRRWVWFSARRIIIHSKRGPATQTAPTTIGSGAARGSGILLAAAIDFPITSNQPWLPFLKLCHSSLRVQHLKSHYFPLTVAF